MFFALCRFMATGQVEALFTEPTFFFKYPGFSWVQPWPTAALMYAHCAVLSVLALCVAVGLFYRPAIVLFGLGFLWLELIDVTNYLNHYYLVVLLCVVMSVMPLGRVYSVDAWLKPERAIDLVPIWALYLLRFQLAVVYFNAGLAKAGADWLLHAQPLGIWFAARSETPLIGPLLAMPSAAWVASWAGFLFDLTVVLWLSLRRTRPFAYAGLIVFHVLTGVLFDIGIFPIVMTVAALIFFAPSWPRALLTAVRSSWPVRALMGQAASFTLDRGEARAARSSANSASGAPFNPLSRTLVVLGLLWCVAHTLIPLRHLIYPGDVIWNEAGMRFSWKVMLREKNGSVTFRVRDVVTGREVFENPKRYLTHRQLNEMSSQPDLIIQAARHIGAAISKRWGHPVEVRADAWASLNGRPMARLIDPSANLMFVDDVVLPMPSTAPLEVFVTSSKQARASR